MRPVPATAVDLVKSYEGFRAKRYFDAVGNPTIGYGHLLSVTDPLWDAELTEQQAADVAASDLDKVSAKLWIALGPNVAATLTDNQWAALLDFVFNEGISHFKNSTLCHYVVTGAYAAAADEFPKWIYAGKPAKALAGLVTRRGAERALWLS